MVCLDTPTSRATSSTARPASTCFKALIISASLCLPLDMVLPLSFDEIIFNFVRNQGSRSGQIRYIDVFRVEHTTYYCERVENGNFHICNEGNYTDFKQPQPPPNCPVTNSTLH